MNTLLQQFVKVRSTNSTDSSFPSRVATVTRPSGDGVIEPRSFGEFTRGTLVLVPYGTGADNATVDVRVLAWRPTTGGLWIPTIVSQVACTLSGAVGVSGQDVTNTERFADTLTLSIGNAGIDCQVFSPANDTVGHVTLDTKGAALLEVTFDLGTATAANALAAWV